MRTLETISTICTAFKEGKFGIEEFQSRLETAMISDDLKQSLDKAMFDAINRLEEIRFSSLEINFSKHGAEVADTLLKIINSIKKTRK